MSTNGNGFPNPLFLPLAAVLRNRLVRVRLACHLECDIRDVIRPGRVRMKELRVTAPLLAEHRLDPRRRMAIGLNWSLDTWRKPLNRRGINVLSVSEDGLISNTQGIADTICEYIYRVKQEDLREMIQAGMPVAAIAAFTGVPPNEIRRITPCFFGKTVLELREEVV